MLNSVFEKIHVPALIWVWVFQSMYWVVANCIAKHLGGQFSRKLTGIMNFPRTSASFTCCKKIYNEIIAECVKVNWSFMLKFKFSLNDIQMFSLQSFKENWIIRNFVNLEFILGRHYNKHKLYCISGLWLVYTTLLTIVTLASLLVHWVSPYFGVTRGTKNSQLLTA